MLKGKLVKEIKGTFEFDLLTDVSRKFCLGLWEVWDKNFEFEYNGRLVTRVEFDLRGVLWEFINSINKFEMDLYRKRRENFQIKIQWN